MQNHPLAQLSQVRCRTTRPARSPSLPHHGVGRLEVTTHRACVHDAAILVDLPKRSPPPPPCNLPPLAISHPHPGDRHFHVFLVNIYCAGLWCPSALHMALHCFPVTSNQAPVCIL